MIQLWDYSLATQKRGLGQEYDEYVSQLENAYKITDVGSLSHTAAVSGTKEIQELAGNQGLVSGVSSLKRESTKSNYEMQNEDYRRNIENASKSTRSGFSSPREMVDKISFGMKKGATSIGNYSNQDMSFWHRKDE